MPASAGGAKAVGKAASPRRAGPPRKADHRTGANAAFARAVAAGLPSVTMTERRGVTSCAVDDRVFLAVGDDDDSVAVRQPDGQEHRFLLRTVGRDEVRARIEEAWAAVAQRRDVTAYRRARARRDQQPPMTRDDIRRAILSLPGAAEGPIWGHQIGFLIGSDKKTRFARFGPPEADGVGNLLPPDDEDTLVILHCPQRQELLASSPDRFFTTPHYGAPDEPGGIIVRLSEHRGPEELAEVVELLEDAWRHVAPAELVAQLDGRVGPAG